LQGYQAPGHSLALPPVYEGRSSPALPAVIRDTAGGGGGRMSALSQPRVSHVSQGGMKSPPPPQYRSPSAGPGRASPSGWSRGELMAVCEESFARLQAVQRAARPRWGCTN
jgi:hypothetical protein